jgi:regulator of protease activity HflC (stomatin/prohibitin superfamily)
MKKTLIAILTLAVLAGISCVRVDSDEIGVRVLNLPFVNRIERAPKLTGYHLCIPKLHDFYILPRTRQTLRMIETGQVQLKRTGVNPERTAKSPEEELETPTPPETQMDQVQQDIDKAAEVQIVVHDRRVGNQSVRVKTADGNDAWVNVIVTYYIVPEKAWLVVRKVGLADSNNRIASIVGAEVRGIIHARLGELTSAELLRAEDRRDQVEGVLKRDGAVEKKGALQELNERLELYGIGIESLAAPSVVIHPDYAAVLKRRQVAEQDRYAYLAYQLHAQQEKETKVNRARGEANAMIELAKGRLLRATQQADAELEAMRMSAEADRVRYNELGAGIAALTAQLGGPGGNAQVALAVSQALQGKKIYVLPGTGTINTLDLNELLQNAAAVQTVQQKPDTRLGPPSPPKTPTAAAAPAANGFSFQSLVPAIPLPPNSSGNPNGQPNGNGITPAKANPPPSPQVQVQTRPSPAQVQTQP